MHFTTFVLFAFGLFAFHTTAIPSLVDIMSTMVVAAKEGEANNGTTDHHNGTIHKNGTSHHMNSTHVQCAKMARLTKLTAISKNSTEKAEVVSKAKNATMATEEIDAAPAKLAAMTTNSTLVTECAVVDASLKLHDQCKTIRRLTKLTTIANNATEVAEIAGKSKNATRTTDQIKGAASKLATLTSNSTLMAACSSEAEKPEASGSKLIPESGSNIR